MVFDFETSSKSKEKAQILQIGAIAVERNNLRIVGEFNSLMKPERFDEIEQEALQVNKLTIPQLEAAPETKIVWKQFTDWVMQYNTSKKPNDPWGNPIPCGYNINNYDLPIASRYCREYGPWDSKWDTQKLFHAIHKIDLMDCLFFWFENNPDLNKLNLVAVLEYMGMDQEAIAGAHDALVDVKNTWAILEKLIRMERFLTTRDQETKKRRLEMKGCFVTKE